MLTVTFPTPEPYFTGICAIPTELHSRNFNKKCWLVDCCHDSHEGGETRESQDTPTPRLRLKFAAESAIKIQVSGNEQRARHAQTSPYNTKRKIQNVLKPYFSSRGIPYTILVQMSKKRTHTVHTGQNAGQDSYMKQSTYVYQYTKQPSIGGLETVPND